MCATYDSLPGYDDWKTGEPMDEWDAADARDEEELDEDRQNALEEAFWETVKMRRRELEALEASSPGKGIAVAAYHRATADFPDPHTLWASQREYADRRLDRTLGGFTVKDWLVLGAIVLGGVLLLVAKEVWL